MVSFLVRPLLKYWLPVLLWMIFIFIGSSDLMSAEHTSRFLVPFLRWIAPDISPATLAFIQLLIRKCAHLTEYAILATLLCRAFSSGRRDFWRAAVAAFAIAAVYAGLDEFHQSFIPSRTGAFQDVMIDCGGAILGLVLYSFGRRFLRRRWPEQKLAIAPEIGEGSVPQSVLSRDAPALVVDLDGSLIATDLLHESLLLLVRHRPLDLLRIPFWLMRGKAATKAELVARVKPNVARLPYRAQIVQYLADSRAAGRTVILATASHRLLADAVASHLGLFNAVIASEDDRNLSAARKLAAIHSHLGAGTPFEYIGNERTDLPIWAEAEAGRIVGGSAGLRRRVASLTRVGAGFAPGGGSLRQIMRAVRPLQWTKNALLLLPVLLAHEFPGVTGLAKFAVAILTFSLFASGVYVLNDLLDLEADRQHPRKRTRPFAAGALTPRTGVLLSTLFPTLGLSLALAVLPLAFSAILALYGCVTLGYSLYLKRVPVVDVITLAALHTLRIIAGAHVLPGIDVSGWLLGFSLLFFLSLAFAKRFAEIQTHSSESTMQLPGRGYYSEHLGLVRALGWGSAFGAVLVIAFYLGSDKVQTLYRHPTLLWLTCPAVILWLGRIWFLAQEGKLHDDPVVFALSDPISYLTGITILIVAVLAV